LSHDATGLVTIGIGFDNPNLFAVSVYWLMSAAFDSNVTFVGGFLNTVIQPGKHVENVTINALSVPDGDHTLTSVIFYESYSVLSDVFSEPRIFSNIVPYSLSFHAPTFVNQTAVNFPGILWFMFNSHSNYNPNEPLC